MNSDADNALLDWVESSGLENVRAHIKSADDIKREANTALTLLAAGAGGSLAYAIKFIEPTQNISAIFGLGSLSVYLFSLCTVLVIKCLMVGDFPSPTNEPQHLNQKGYPLQALREAELKNLQRRIEAASRINAQHSRWLNRILIAATASPFVFVVAFFVTFFLESPVRHLF